MQQVRDTLWYRQHPLEFNLLPYEQQRQLLAEVCGEGDFVFRIDPLLPKLAMCTPSQWNWYYHEEHYPKGHWNDLAKTLFFCGARVFQFPNIPPPSNFSAFAKHFPFGCLGQESESNRPANLLNDWCTGNLTAPSVLEQLIQGEEPIFEKALANLATLVLTRTTLLKSCNILGDQLLSFQASAEPQSRINRLLKTLSQLPARPTGDHADEVVFPCMAKFYYNYSSEFGFIPSLPRPVWSPARHLLLADEHFKQTALTILLMQRFRREQFPLHRDLKTLVLRFAFDAHVASLEEALLLRRRDLLNWDNNHTHEAKRAQGLDVGIHLSLTNLPAGYNYYHVGADIYDLLHGKSIPVKRSRDYRDAMVAALQLGCYWLFNQLSAEVRGFYLPGGREKLAEDFLAWLAAEGKPLSLYFDRTTQLSPAELLAFQRFLEEQHEREQEAAEEWGIERAGDPDYQGAS